MANSFCGYLSNGYSLRLNWSNDLIVGPCCFFKEKITIDQLEKNSVFWRSIDNWSENCQSCQFQEQVGQRSFRQSSNDWIDANDTSNDPYTIEVFLDNVCNSACVTCDETASTFWGQQLRSLSAIPTVEKVNKLSIDSLINRIASSLSLKKLTFIKFFGGEPLLTDTHLKFLQQVPHPENVTLHYTTNGSIYPNKDVREMWKKFKLVILAASIDGTGKQFNYIRWPLDWDKVSSNLVRLRDSDLWNVMFRVEFTANFLNTYYYDQVETWVNTYFGTNSSGDRTEINIHSCVGSPFDLVNMPQEIRNAIYKKYNADHIVHQWVLGLPEPASLDKWKKFVSVWDSKRNNSWKLAFPELVTCLNSYI